MNKVNPIQVSLVVIIIATFIIPVSILIVQHQTNLDQTILIESDEDFLKYDFEGEGTEASPYLIEDRTIIKTLIKNATDGETLKLLSRADIILRQLLSEN